MQLKKITMHGFKSFADKTEMEFGDGVTVIVGPNGCGKSNVVDAVKWVLGEQSAKSLRGGQMLDVIFNGSSNRKSMGFCEVSLHFSNSQILLHSDEDEVSVSRKLYRSGESEYMLNQKICRLKDIREMFMDTGIGADTYSLIEQGKVESLLQTSKQDRRSIFEEAAGISKYKSRRREAQRKLERTEQNQLRLTDVIDEIEKRLRSIKYQAGKARHYQNYTARLNELRLHQYLYEYRELKDQAKSGQQNLTQKQDKLIATTTSNEQVQTRLSLLGHEIDQAERCIREAENALLQCTSQIGTQQDRIELGHRRCDELSELIAKNRSQMQGLREQSRELENEIGSDQAMILEYENQIQNQQEELEAHQQSRQQQALALAENRAELEDEKSGLLDIVRRTAQLHNEIQSFDVKRDNLSGQKDRLSDRSGKITAEIEEQFSLKAALDAKSQELESLISQSQTQLDSKREQLEQLDGQRAVCVENLSAAKEQRSAMQSRQQLLSDLEDKLEGLDQGVQQILKARQENPEAYYYVKDIVADIIQAEVTYASIIDAALTDRAQDLVVTSSQAVLEDEANLSGLKGRVQMICLDRLPPFKNGYDFSRHPEVQAKCIDLVSFPPDCQALAWHLLGKTILVDSLDSAMRLAQIAPSGYRWVTLSGEVLEADGVIRLGSKAGQMGLVSRKSELRQIDVSLTELAERIGELENQREQLAGQADHLDKNLQELRTTIYENNTEKIETRSRAEQLESTLNRLKQEQPLIAAEMSQLEEQIAESVKLQETSRQSLAEMQANNDQRQAHINHLETVIGQLLEKELSCNEQITELKVSLGQIQQKRLALHERVKSVEVQIQQFGHNVTTLGRDIDHAQSNLSDSQRNILSAETAIAELFQSRQDHEVQARQLREQRTDYDQERVALDTQAKEFAIQRETFQEQIHQIQMQLNEIDLRMDNLKQRAIEDISLDLEEHDERLENSTAMQPQLQPETNENESDGEGAGASEEAEQAAETSVDDIDYDQMDWNAVAEEIQSLKEKISRPEFRHQ